MPFGWPGMKTGPSRAAAARESHPCRTRHKEKPLRPGARLVGALGILVRMPTDQQVLHFGLPLGPFGVVVPGEGVESGGGKEPKGEVRVDSVGVRKLRSLGLA